jgi:hypothetical protein
LGLLISALDLAQQLIAGLGWAWAVAAALEFLAIIAEGAAKERIDETREPEAERESGQGLAAGIMLVMSGLSTAFLFAHVVFSSSLAYEPILRFIGFGVVAFVVIFGTLVGYAAGSSGPGAHRAANVIKVPLAVLAFGATVFATLPSIVMLFTLVGRFLG